MVVYWRHQFWIDATVIFLLALIATKGWLPFFQVDLSGKKVVETSKLWVGPTLTILGLVCATTAFLFSALERSEFGLLRKLGVEEQLWFIFSEIIFWLTVSAISLAMISFLSPEGLSVWIKGFALFLFAMVALCLLKFAWVMRHIIGVRTRS